MELWYPRHFMSENQMFWPPFYGWNQPTRILVALMLSCSLFLFVLKLRLSLKSLKGTLLLAFLQFLNGFTIGISWCFAASNKNPICWGLGSSISGNGAMGSSSNLLTSSSKWLSGKSEELPTQILARQAWCYSTKQLLTIGGAKREVCTGCNIFSRYSLMLPPTHAVQQQVPPGSALSVCLLPPFPFSLVWSWLRGLSPRAAI